MRASRHPRPQKGALTIAHQFHWRERVNQKNRVPEGRLNQARNLGSIHSQATKTGLRGAGVLSAMAFHEKAGRSQVDS
jgi:hypothetical protein